MEENKHTRILLVDDDRFLLDMYVLKFQKSGFQVDTASGSMAALDKLRGGQVFDIIILDIIMPTMDGLELLKTIRQEKLASQATIIVLTNNQNEDQERAEKLGIDGYIIKATAIPSEVVQTVTDIHSKKHKN